MQNFPPTPNTIIDK